MAAKKVRHIFNLNSDFPKAGDPESEIFGSAENIPESNEVYPNITTNDNKYMLNILSSLSLAAKATQTSLKSLAEATIVSNNNIAKLCETDKLNSDNLNEICSQNTSINDIPKLETVLKTHIIESKLTIISYRIIKNLMVHRLY